MKEAHEYPYLLPHGKQPKAISPGILPTKPSAEIRVEFEYRDTPDRTVYKYAHGGQSSDHELMSVGRWFRTGKPRRVYWHSDFGELWEVAHFQFGRMLPMWSPTIEAEGKVMRRNVLRWFEKRGINVPESEREDPFH